MRFVISRKDVFQNNFAQVIISCQRVMPNFPTDVFVASLSFKQILNSGKALRGKKDI